jgi:hypothetical protein
MCSIWTHRKGVSRVGQGEGYKGRGREGGVGGGFGGRLKGSRIGKKKNREESSVKWGCVENAGSTLHVRENAFPAPQGGKSFALYTQVYLKRMCLQQGYTDNIKRYAMLSFP